MNAAFGQNKSADSMGNVIDNGETTSTSSLNNQKTAIKLYRTLTEKRKDYVRRVSAAKPNSDKVLTSYGSLHRTFKPRVFKTFSFDSDGDDYEAATSDNSPEQNAQSVSKSIKRIESLSQTDKSNVVPKVATNNRQPQDKELINDPEHEDITTPESSDEEEEDFAKLFQLCLLIGYNTSTGQAYIKSKFPPDEDVPQNIEQLVFPSRQLINQGRDRQDYSLILTDSNGYHIYGYCRRVLPESCEICLPLAYCIVSEVRAPAFYFKILKEIESRHGQSEFQTTFLLQNLQNRPIPDAGKFLHLKLPTSPRSKTISSASSHKISPNRLSIEVNPKWLTESAAQLAESASDLSSSSTTSKKDRPFSKPVEKRQEKSNNNAGFDLSLINRSLLSGSGIAKCDEIFIRRPNDLRLESTELNDLYKALGPDLLITVFSSLLLERKVIMCSDNITQLSSCVLGLQTLLYPFQWQYTLVTVLPQQLIEICQAPIPVLAGMLEPIKFEIDDGIVVDLNNRSITQKCGDEATILPNSLSSALKQSLQMVNHLDKGKMLSSVLVAEAFLRFFVELFVGYKQKHFDVGHRNAY